MRTLSLLAAASLLVACPALAGTSKRVAVTIDDLPVVSTAATDTAAWKRVTVDLLAKLQAYEVPAVGFVNEKRLYPDGAAEPDPERVALLEMWLDAGMELGNHTYSHLNLHAVEVEQFQQDVIRGETVTRALLAGHDTEPRWFRHPYLRTGRDLETKRTVEAFLAQHGYRVAPVTIDNSEWIYSKAYDRATARGDGEARERIARSYVDYMEDKFAFFERNTEELFGRPIPQVLLIHANPLNADRFDALAERLVERGYRFVTLDEALADEAYASEDRYTGQAGITWLHRWAITREMPREFFAGEPRTPEFVMEQAGVESE